MKWMLFIIFLQSFLKIRFRWLLKSFTLYLVDKFLSYRDEMSISRCVKNTFEEISESNLWVSKSSLLPCFCPHHTFS